MIETGSLEHNQRLTNLVNNHETWLRQVMYNLTTNEDVVDDMIQELYLYLSERRDRELYYLDSFNLKYCYLFLRSRFTNLIKRENKNIYVGKFKDTPNDDYDDRWDNELEKFETSVKQELKRLQSTSMWSSAKIYEMYQFGDDTMETLSDKIGISKSTTFLSVKKVKEHLKNTIDKPIKPNE